MYVFISGYLCLKYVVEFILPSPQQFYRCTAFLRKASCLCFFLGKSGDLNHEIATLQLQREGNGFHRTTKSSVAAASADIEPYLVDGGRGDPDDVTPHALRHSVAYRMMNVEEDNTLYDVRNRLRHRSIQTTERVYDHMIRV